MKYFIYGKQATRDQVKQHLLEEYEMAKDSPFFQGKIFYNLEYLEHSAKQDMKITGEKHWSYFSLRFEV